MRVGDGDGWVFVCFGGERVCCVGHPPTNRRKARHRTHPPTHTCLPPENIETPARTEDRPMDGWMDGWIITSTSTPTHTYTNHTHPPMATPRRTPSAGPLMTGRTSLPT